MCTYVALQKAATNLGVRGSNPFGRAIQLVKSDIGTAPEIQKGAVCGILRGSFRGLILFVRLRNCRRQFLPGFADCGTDERLVPNCSLRDENTESFRALISGTVIGISRLDLAERPRCA